MKTLIVAYSYGGNTRRIAQMIRQETGGDLVEIETAEPYRGDYDAVVDQGRREVNSGYMPPIRPIKADVSAYERIVLGSPVWWYTFAPAMKTFLHENDLSGKIVCPFATNGGWIGHTLRDFASACPGAQVMPGLNVRFEENRLITGEEEIRRWARG